MEHPSEGDYRPDHAPIRVCRKTDGEPMVISGRHRLDVAKRAGATRISAYVYDASGEQDLSWARRYDIESNIRDNQATPPEVAQYVVRCRNELAQDASYLNATAKKKNAEEMGKKYGVDVKGPVALKKKLAEINALRERWKNPYSDSELMDGIRQAWRGREGGDMSADEYRVGDRSTA